MLPFAVVGGCGSFGECGDVGEGRGDIDADAGEDDPGGDVESLVHRSTRIEGGGVGDVAIEDEDVLECWSSDRDLCRGVVTEGDRDLRLEDPWKLLPLCNNKYSDQNFLLPYDHRLFVTNYD